MKFCTVCKKPNRDSAKYCRFCSSELPKNDESDLKHINYTDQNNVKLSKSYIFQFSTMFTIIFTVLAVLVTIGIMFYLYKNSDSLYEESLVGVLEEDKIESASDLDHIVAIDQSEEKPDGTTTKVLKPEYVDDKWVYEGTYSMDAYDVTSYGELTLGNNNYSLSNLFDNDESTVWSPGPYVPTQKETTTINIEKKDKSIDFDVQYIQISIGALNSQGLPVKVSGINIDITAGTTGTSLIEPDPVLIAQMNNLESNKTYTFDLHDKYDPLYFGGDRFDIGINNHLRLTFNISDDNPAVVNKDNLYISELRIY